MDRWMDGWIHLCFGCFVTTEDKKYHVRKFVKGGKLGLCIPVCIECLFASCGQQWLYVCATEKVLRYSKTPVQSVLVAC